MKTFTSCYYKPGTMFIIYYYSYPVTGKSVAQIILFTIALLYVRNQDLGD